MQVPAATVFVRPPAASRYQQLRGHLAYLKLATAAEALPAVLDTAKAENLSPTATLEKLLRIEVQATEARRLERRIRSSNLPTAATIEDFDFDAQPGVDPDLIRDLGSNRYLETGTNILIIGPPGVGKTMLAIGLARKVAEAGHRTYFTNAADLTARCTGPRSVHPPGLQPVIGPDLRDGVLAHPDLSGQGSGGPMRGAAGRFTGQGQPDHPLHRARRQPGLAPATLGDPTDAVDALVGEPLPPPPHRVRAHPRPTSDLLVRHPISRPQQRLRLHHLTVRQHRRSRQTAQQHPLLISHRQRRSHHQPILN
jgi:hypothetical protein